jgi:hypothetical protein
MSGAVIWVLLHMWVSHMLVSHMSPPHMLVSHMSPPHMLVSHMWSFTYVFKPSHLAPEGFLLPGGPWGLFCLVVLSGVVWAVW